ncbi:MAG TPA: hypothetical protein VFS66_11225 [Acidimicrobiia bacterium]|nr:hypothetical protein [Acidimicrobiia bacterium]
MVELPRTGVVVTDTHENRSDDGWTPSPKDLWKLILAIVGLVAVIQELRKPKDERTWHGQVAFFPYDFRIPTIDRFRRTYWNPGGPIISGKVFGVGWAPNFGVLARFFGDSERGEAAD